MNLLEKKVNLLIPLIWLGLIVGFTVASRSCCDVRGELEAALNRKGAAVLMEVEIGENLRVSYDHLDGVVTGRVASEEEAKQVMAFLEREMPAGRLIHRLRVSDVIETSKWDDALIHFLARETEEGVFIEGVVPDDRYRKLIGGGVQSRDDGVSIENGLVIKRGILPQKWSEKIPDLIKSHFDAVDQGEVEVTEGGDVILRGRVGSEVLAKHALDQQRLLLGDVVIVSEVVFPVAGVGNDGVSIEEQDGLLGEHVPRGRMEIWATKLKNKIEIRGQVRSVSLKENIGRKLSEAHPGVSVTNELEVQEELMTVPYENDLAAIISDYLKSVNHGSIGLESDRRFVLKGEFQSLNSREEQFALLSKLLGEGVELEDDTSVAKTENSLRGFAGVGGKRLLSPDSAPDDVTKKLVQDLKLNPVFFATNVTVVAEDEIGKVKKAAELIKATGYAYRLECAGYADHRGNSDVNQRLSVQRANRVKAELVKLGVPEEHISVKSYGDKRNQKSTSVDEALRSERRVEIKILK